MARMLVDACDKGDRDVERGTHNGLMLGFKHEVE